MKNLIILLLFLMCDPVYAEIVSVNDINVTLRYTEPSIDANGDPLQDLAFTTIYYDMGAGWIGLMQVPATSPNGGGIVTQVVTIPVADGVDIAVKIQVSATDLANQEGNMSLKVEIVKIDKLAPGAPIL